MPPSSSARRFWRNADESSEALAEPTPWWQALADTLNFRYLKGGSSDGCTYPDENASLARRWHHHLTFYGILLCFAATVSATVYAYGFRSEAPYLLLSVPVVFGTVGGVGLLVGPAGLLWLKRRADPEPYDDRARDMDVAFLVLLMLTSVTGLLLLSLRTTPAMGPLLAVHLGVVLGLFLTLPYGKFIHAIYRFAALVRYAVERRRPLQFEIAEG